MNLENDNYARAGWSDWEKNANNGTHNRYGYPPEWYTTIAANKTLHDTFCLPIAAAIYLAGLKDYKDFASNQNDCYQVQDDFLDCFGKPEITGKLSTDIQDNKCSWLAMVCMQRANDSNN
uniref:Uncharacterized protein n=1 Tax=Glossina pallidipes TaxID=7398 RepID=A0A1A9Z9E9_GLOPL